jgi:arylsulfatase A
LSSDVGESKNLAVIHPDKTIELREALGEWRTRIGARLPVPNPDHDPARAGEMKGGKGKRGGVE